MNYLTDNTRIVEKFDLITPNEVLEKYLLQMRLQRLYMELEMK